MINLLEVNQTNKMIEEENLDVRTITLGISLLDCASDSVEVFCEKIFTKITNYAKDLVSTGDEIEKKYGIPIVNKESPLHQLPLLHQVVLKQKKITLKSRKL